MHGTYVIEVAHKPGIVDSAARGLHAAVRHAGARSVKSVSTAQLYRLVGDLSAEEQKRISEELLCDPIIQTYQKGGPRAVPTASTRCVAIDVWYKSGVTDTVGESVLKGVRDLGVEGISEVRTGMRYRLWGLKDLPAADKLALALLVNLLVHDKFIHAD